MTKEEFNKLIEDSAVEYAVSTVDNPDEHSDAVDAIVIDYVEGAIKAYELLIGTYYE